MNYGSDMLSFGGSKQAELTQQVEKEEKGIMINVCVLCRLALVVLLFLCCIKQTAPLHPYE